MFPVLNFIGKWDPVTPPANGAGVGTSYWRKACTSLGRMRFVLNGLEGTDFINHLQPGSTVQPKFEYRLCFGEEA